MLDRTTFEATTSAISSPASAGGQEPYVSRVGQIIDQFGREAVLANLSPSQASKAGLLTSGTCGRSGDISSRSAALQSSLESRLRQLLHGSDLCEVIWKPWTTPWGQFLSKPRARVRTTSGTGSGLWQTMVADDAMNREGGKVNSRGEPKLSVQATWATPSTRDHKDGGYCPNVPVTGLLGRMVWPTPTSLAKAKDGNNEAGNSAGLVAIRKHALWAITSGSSVPTENRGALNPEFVCWLMGYPAEWLSCAPSAMPSTSGRRQRSSTPYPRR